MTTDTIERRSTGAFEPVEKDELSTICAALLQRARRDGRFRYPARDAGTGTAEERQQAAIAALISGACDIAEKPPAIMTRREFEATRAKLRTAADALYALSTPLDPRYTGIDPFALVAPINEIETEIVQLRHTVVVIERDRGSDPRVQAVAAGIGQLCYLLFGTVMSGVVAGLTEALIGTKVERYEVRNWTALIAKQ